MSVTFKKLLEVWEKRPDFWDPNNVIHLEWTSQELLPAVMGALPALRAAVGAPAVVPPPPVTLPAHDPNTVWDEELGWLPATTMDKINDLRGALARASQPNHVPEPGGVDRSTGTQESLQSEERSNRILNATPSTAGTGAYPGQAGGTDGTPASEPATSPVSMEQLTEKTTELAVLRGKRDQKLLSKAIANLDAKAAKRKAAAVPQPQHDTTQQPVTP